MIALLVAILSLYNIFLLVLNIGWGRIKVFATTPLQPKLFYSVLVPFRNEVDNLPKLLASLGNLDFPVEQYEIILINDHSADDFEGVLRQFTHLNLRLLNLEESQGKKAALQLGIEKARGAVIATTDADCSVPTKWLTVIANYFETREAQMVFGGVAFTGVQAFFEKLQRMEFATLIGSGAATLGLGFPSMCNGANLAFRKNTFYEVGGYSDNASIPSGDDEFLMHKMHGKCSGGVYFLKQSEAVVSTKPLQNFREFYQQRVRWASKWKAYANIKNSLLAVIVLLFNLTIIASFCYIFLGKYESFWLIGLLIFKIILEAIFIKRVLNCLGNKFHLLAFTFLQISYPFYVVLCGLSANFGHYSWKGRRHKL